MAKEGFRKFQELTNEKKLDGLTDMIEQLATKQMTMDGELAKYETIFGSVEDIEDHIRSCIEKVISKDVVVDLKHTVKLSLEKYIDNRFTDFQKLADDMKRERETTLAIMEARKKISNGYDAFQGLFLNFGCICNGSLASIKALIDDLEPVYGIKMRFSKTVPQNIKLLLTTENYNSANTEMEQK